MKQISPHHESLLSRLTVAIPVFHNKSYIRQAVLSSASQAGCVLVYDNASEDDTGRIVEELANHLPNVQYRRHPKNLGAFKNFELLLQDASTEYFMWLSGNDFIAENYARSLISSLDSDPAAVLAFGKICSVDEESKIIGHYEYEFFKSLQSDDALKRVFTIIKKLGNCAMLHGIFRTEALQRSWHSRPCKGFDHIILCHAAKLGKLLYNHTTYYARREVKTPYPEANHRMEVVCDSNRGLSERKDRHKELRDTQLALIDSLPTFNPIKKYYYYYRSAIALNRWPR